MRCGLPKMPCKSTTSPFAVQSKSERSFTMKTYHLNRSAALHWRNTFVLMILVLCAHSFAFAPPPPRVAPSWASIDAVVNTPKPRTNIFRGYQTEFNTRLYAEEDPNELSPALNDSDSTILGVAGIVASAIMLYSESVLFQTGCGLPRVH